jgi:hypothetical protein
MIYGESCRSVGIKTRWSGRLASNYSSFSEHREAALFVRITATYAPPPRLPGEREMPRMQALPSAPSAWTLMGPEVHLDRKPVPRDPDMHRRLVNKRSLEPGTGDLTTSTPPLAVEERDLPNQDARYGDGLPVHGGQSDPVATTDSPQGVHSFALVHAGSYTVQIYPSFRHRAAERRSFRSEKRSYRLLEPLETTLEWYYPL